MQTKTPNRSLLSFGRRLSKFRCLNLRKSNKYTCSTLFTSDTTIRRIFFILVACDSGNWIIQSTCKPHSNRTHCITLILFYIIKLTQTACKWNFIYRIFCRHVRLNADTFASETCLFSNSLIIAPKFNLQALAVADSDPLSKTSSFFGVDAKLVCDVRLSDRLNVSRRFRSDDSDVDFLGELFVGLTTSSSLSARTYKLPIFSLIFCVFA